MPHPALALPRLVAAADMPQVVERLRAAALLPPDDYLALEEGVPDVAQGARLGSTAPWTVMDRVAAIAGSAAYIGDSPTACAIAAAYGRPAVWTGPHGMSELMTVLGVDELGGAVHVGLMPHTTHVEVDQLAIALDDLLGSGQSRLPA